MQRSRRSRLGCILFTTGAGSLIRSIVRPRCHAVDISPKKRVLFVCTQNKFRSVTAEHLYRGRAELEVRSAGVGLDARVPLTAELLAWADEIYVFERRQRNVIHKRFRELYEKKSIVCLYVPDEFEFMSP